MDVKFDEEDIITTHRAVRPHRTSTITNLVIKSRLAKTAKGAEHILLALALVSIASALFVFIDLGRASQLPTPVPNANWP